MTRNSITDKEILIIRRLYAEKKKFRLTTREIGEITGFSSATVSYWVRKEGLKVNIRVPRLKRTSQMKKADARRRLVARISKRRVLIGGRMRVVFQSTQAIADELLRTYDIKVTKETVRRDLLHWGLTSVLRPRVTTVATNDHRARLAFAKAYVNRDPLEFVFCDEKLFSTNDFTSRRQWVQQGEIPQSREQKRWPTARVMVWGAIGHGFRKLVIFPEKRKVVDKKTGDETEVSAPLSSKNYESSAQLRARIRAGRGRLPFCSEDTAIHPLQRRPDCSLAST